MKQNKLIIFDFDGVILDSFEVAFSILSKLNKKYGLFPLEEREHLEDLFEGNVWENYEKMGLKGKIKKSFTEEFKQEYQKKKKELKFYSNISSLLKKISRRFTLAIISSNHSSSIKGLLQKNKLDGYISSILGAEMVGNKKKKIGFILDKLKITPNNTYFVSDTTGDIIEAKETNIHTIGVTWGYHSFERLEKSKPDKIVNAVKELESYLYATG